jgi:hypothetical protein
MSVQFLFRIQFALQPFVEHVLPKLPARHSEVGKVLQW